MVPGRLGARNDIVRAVFLVGGNEVGVVNARKRLQLRHLLADLVLERRLQDAGAVHGLGEVQAADIPTADDQVIGVQHRQHVVEGDVDFLSVLVGAQLDSGAHNDGAIVVGRLLALTAVPGEATAVGNDTSGHGAAVVAAPADKHDTNLGNLAVDLEVVGFDLGRGDILAVRSAGDLSGVVGVLGLDGVVSVDDVGRVHSEQRSISAGRPPVHRAGDSNSLGRVRSHCG